MHVGCSPFGSRALSLATKFSRSLTRIISLQPSTAPRATLQAILIDGSRLARHPAPYKATTTPSNFTRMAIRCCQPPLIAAGRNKTKGQQMTMKLPRPKRLKAIRVDEISSVDRGTGEGCEVVRSAARRSRGCSCLPAPEHLFVSRVGLVRVGAQLVDGVLTVLVHDDVVRPQKLHTLFKGLSTFDGRVNVEAT